MGRLPEGNLARSGAMAGATAAILRPRTQACQPRKRAGPGLSHMDFAVFGMIAINAAWRRVKLK